MEFNFVHRLNGLPELCEHLAKAVSRGKVEASNDSDIETNNEESRLSQVPETFRTKHG